jgi:hypothetical protein
MFSNFLPFPFAFSGAKAFGRMTFGRSSTSVNPWHIIQDNANNQNVNERNGIQQKVIQ